MTLSCQYAIHSSSGTSSKPAWRASPTLLTRTSRPPSAAAASATTRSGSPATDRSATTWADSPMPGALRRPQLTTRAPSPTSCRVISSPIPPVEPVTRQRLPASRRSMSRARLPRVPATIVLVRHGETDWNRDNRFQGHADPPLNDRGRVQARELALEIRRERFASAFTSPLRRALETAEILVAGLGVDVMLDPDFKEADVGSWSGLTRDDVAPGFRTGSARWLEYGHGGDDGETYDELGARVVSGLLRIAVSHEGETVLAVTHGGPIRSALAAAERVPFDEARRSIHVVANCAVVELEVHDGGLRRPV